MDESKKKSPKDQDRIEELRKRLYSRDAASRTTTRTELTDTPTEESEAVRTHFDVPASEKKGERQEGRTATKRRGIEAVGRAGGGIVGWFVALPFRMKILTTAGTFFLLALFIAISLTIFGDNTISGENIAVSIDGPFTVGGGEELALQIAIRNNNAVVIETATLIVEYPDGTQSVEESGAPLSMERIPLDRIRQGETVNVPLRARVFGEENEEQFIRASIEYRVSGSNATFFKEIDPYRYKISSSPVTLSIDAVEKVAAGQEIELTITATSNAAEELFDLVLELAYPQGFELREVSQPPAAGENTWEIGSLPPEGEKEITITGILIGSESESRTIRGTLGVADTRSSRTLASILATTNTEITIEQPFIEVNIEGANTGTTDDAIAIAPGSVSSLSVALENVLPDTLYDMSVVVELSGNALQETMVSSNRGFYDSNTQTIVWDQSSDRTLAEFPPGAEKRLQFTLDPNPLGVRTPQINVSASVRARRVRESNVTETLVGTDRTSVRIASALQARGATLYGTGPFQDTGPVPPRVGETTTYTLQLQVQNGSNDLSDAVVTAALPTYVSYESQTVGDGDVAYNASGRSLTWDIGNIGAGEMRTVYVQVAMTPSTSQIDTTPRLLREQQFTATDRFTGTTRTRSQSALTTVLIESPDTSGRVRR